jgi:hypothetical protein
MRGNVLWWERHTLPLVLCAHLLILYPLSVLICVMTVAKLFEQSVSGVRRVRLFTVKHSDASECGHEYVSHTVSLLWRHAEDYRFTVHDSPSNFTEASSRGSVTVYDVVP